MTAMAAPDPTSRYAGQATVSVPTPDGPRVMGAPRIAARPLVRESHEVRPGDRLDLLGRALTGDTTGWWRIADANPEADATLLEQPGRNIAVPGPGAVGTSGAPRRPPG